MKVKVVFARIGLIAVDIVVSAVLTAIPMYLLWNWLMPEIFGLMTLDFMQALGISMLASCLFKSNSSTSSS